MKSSVKNFGIIVWLLFAFTAQAAPGKTFFHNGESRGSNKVEFFTTSLKNVPVKSGWVKKEVAVGWQTTTEVNTWYFELQRSFNNRQYETIGIIKAVGDAKNTATYTFIDAKNENRRGQSYYRLKAVFEDGEEIFTVGVKAKKTGMFDINQTYAAVGIAGVK